MNLQIDQLERKIGYKFLNSNLLQLALTHRSAHHEHNERLEFLGDSILNFVIASDLYERFSFATEGEMSRMRAILVCEQALADIAIKFELSSYINLGQGELKSGGIRRKSTLADAVEAIIGAIFKDSNIDITSSIVLKWYSDKLESLDPKSTKKDPKTRLQEYLQAKKIGLPSYEVIKINGKDHEQEFVVSGTIYSIDNPITAKASSRRKAEQKIAELALEQLKNDK